MRNQFGFSPKDLTVEYRTRVVMTSEVGCESMENLVMECKSPVRESFEQKDLKAVLELLFQDMKVPDCLKGKAETVYYPGLWEFAAKDLLLLILAAAGAFGVWNNPMLEEREMRRDIEDRRRRGEPPNLRFQEERDEIDVNNIDLQIFSNTAHKLQVMWLRRHLQRHEGFMWVKTVVYKVAQAILCGSSPDLGTKVFFSKKELSRVSINVCRNPLPSCIDLNASTVFTVCSLSNRRMPF